MMRSFTVTRPNSCSAFMSAINDTAGIIAKKDSNVSDEDSFLQLRTRQGSFLKKLVSFVEVEEKIVPR